MACSDTAVAFLLCLICLFSVKFADARLGTAQSNLGPENNKDNYSNNNYVNNQHHQDARRTSTSVATLRNEDIIDAIEEQLDFDTSDSGLNIQSEAADIGALSTTPRPSFARTGPPSKEPTPSPTDYVKPGPPPTQPGATYAPTFEFRGPPVSQAPTGEHWDYILNHSEPVPLKFVGQGQVTPEHFPLGPCEADCDTDDDCFGPLVCYERELGGAVPGCLGNNKGKSDFCVFPHHIKNETIVDDKEPWKHGFQIKLYWEEGYRWQNETRERRWCITRDYEGSPITGKCWYGTQSKECIENALYVSKCSDQDDPDPRQLFDFIPVSSNEVLIQAYNESRCFERMRRNVTMEPCDSANPRQKWFAIRGGFNEPRFEISQKGVIDYCINQDHHPKPGEVVAMYSCEKARQPHHRTSWWNLY